MRWGWLLLVLAACDKSSATSSVRVNSAPVFHATHHFEQPIDFIFYANGKRLPGPFHVDGGKKATFTLPTGKVEWRNAACDLSGEDERTVVLDLAPGDVVNVECEQSNREGNCCTRK